MKAIGRIGLILLAMSTIAMAQKAELTSHSAMTKWLATLEAIDATSGYGRMQVRTIGQSVKGKDIPLVTVSNPTVPPETTKKLFIICRQHGNEPASTEAMLSMLENLVLDNDKNAGEILSKVSFYIVPMMNPDGADLNQRRNANGADLNRDWLNLWQPETLCVRKAIDSISPDVIIDEHELSPGNNRSDFLETAGPDSGASPEVAAKSEKMLNLVIGMLRTHDMTVKSYQIEDQHPARLAHRYFPIHGGTNTLLFESRQAGARQYQLKYRMNLHIIGTMTIAKYLAGQGDQLYERIAEYDQRKWVELASRGKKKPVQKKR
ncbi:MAG TPA: M14 family zinc carboxypeptidase [Armatimonadota bacterium]|nr:M14 family zinc carboxypeptidase [Armatimonadota bacterium]